MTIYLNPKWNGKKTSDYICYMLPINIIKNNREEVIMRLAVKNFIATALVDRIIELDEERKKMQFNTDETQAKINTASKDIGRLMAKGDKNLANEKKEEVAKLKTLLQPVDEKLVEIEKTLHDELIKLPNLPHSSVHRVKRPTKMKL